MMKTGQSLKPNKAINSLLILFLFTCKFYILLHLEQKAFFQNFVQCWICF